MWIPIAHTSRLSNRTAVAVARLASAMAPSRSPVNLATVASSTARKPCSMHSD